MQIARGVFSEIRSKKSKDVGAKKQRDLEEQGGGSVFKSASK